MIEQRLLYNDFLYRWPIEKLTEMQLQDYVGIDNPDTFSQWIETKTRILGSIKGMTAIKFGIYQRKDPNKTFKAHNNDEKYSWLKVYGVDRNHAFEEIKKEIIEIANFSKDGRFDLIDQTKLPDFFKWKVAFLYSEERLIPIYKREVLLEIAESYGLQTSLNTKVSEIQKLMMAKKPRLLDVYDFMKQLDEKFNTDKRREGFKN